MVATKSGKTHSVILDYDRHTEELFNEAKAFAKKMGDFLGYEIKIIYGGTDC